MLRERQADQPAKAGRLYGSAWGFLLVDATQGASLGAFYLGASGVSDDHYHAEASSPRSFRWIQAAGKIGKSFELMLLLGKFASPLHGPAFS